MKRATKVGRPRLWFCLWVGLVFAHAGKGFPAWADTLARTIPQTAPDHPGNIFLAGESVVVSAPLGEGNAWRLVDYENRTLTNGLFKDGRAELGKLPVGWYKIVRGGPGYITNRVFACVLEPLRAPTPTNSPIDVDLGMAWFFTADKMPTVANICRLAGINRVRDRLSWPEMEGERGKLAGHNRYDDSARVQSEQGLQILQVNHASPGWANTNGMHFPKDLRDAYNFYREVAKRWKGQVAAFEPWNEADIVEFGGHNGNEMASMQKAAYLGLKAGNPDVIACENVFAIRRAATLSNFNDNEAWACFDTFNVHHYEPLENYPALYADYRAVSAGKPLWVTECSVHVHWQGDEALKELKDEDLRLQSERLVKTYALAIHERAVAVYYFVLPHYTERKLQYGLLRPDLTPRPGFSALAVVGRVLADAKPLGRVRTDDDSIHAYVFEAKPDGKSADVLVAWGDDGGSLELARPPVSCFDHLGRPIALTNQTLTLGRAPIYAVLARDARPALVPPPNPPKLLKGKASEIVLQALPPESDILFKKSAYKAKPGQAETIPIFVYNFGTKPAKGKLKLEAPKEWQAQLPEKIEIAPGDRKEIGLKVNWPATMNPSEDNLRISGDFGSAGNPVLVLRYTSAAE